MNSMSINLNGDKAWSDLAERDVIHLADAEIAVAVLDGGMASGLPSVAFRIDLPDGKTVIAHTSARLFVGAARVITGRYPDLLS